SNKRKGGLLLDSRAGLLQGGDSGAAAVAGAPDKSLLVRALMYSEELKMPPKGRLGAAVVADFQDWIRRGLPWPDSAPVGPPTTKVEKPRPLPWSFQPVRIVPAPAVKDAAWPKNDIDRFILARLEREGLIPAPPAEPAALLRRVTVDLTGLPPTVEELDAYLRDPSPGAFEEAVRRLLASPQFGERFARYWMDVVRYADSTGFGADYTLDDAWRYRDYLIDAFNRDLPYGQFVREQIAGDLLTPPVPVATGFLLVGPKELAEYDKEKLRMDVVDEQLNTIGQAFLGLTLGCARCHDHKFDPVPTADYYALAGILRSTRTIPPGNLSGPISAWNHRLMDPTAEQAKALETWKKEVERARTRLVQVRDRKGAVAEARTLERAIARLKADPGADADQIRRLESELAKKKSVVAPTPEEIERLENELLRAYMRPKPDEVLAVEDEKAPADLRINIRGDVHNLGAPAPRGFLGTIPLDGRRPIDPKSSGRLQLAEWIAHPDHPLTARVAVNRLWHYLMGAGLVRTVDNFGARGEAPSHPELLDHLARRLREERGSLKAIVREIVLSRTYQMAARGGSTDPENRLLGRRSLRRLDAEALRDAMLAVSGELDGTRGGSTMTYTGRLFVPLESIALPADPWRRRAVYLPIYRGTTAPDLLEAFDFAPPGMVTGRRASTTVPTQALFLMNSPFVLDRAKALARSLRDRADLDDAGRVDLLYRKLFARPSREIDRRRALEFVRGSGPDAWTDLAQALFASNEFLFLE
ncbi:MAG: DUF1549 domain-containing protein, partial [Planctomycetaceae bacterium]|nr:DUF1549 domain-containing protein [Planctomycetaceae bacterium]